MPQSAIDQTVNNQTEFARIKPSDIAQISNDFFHSMLGMEFNPAPKTQCVQWDGPVMASIQIEGDWNAEFEVVASKELAAEIARAMFGIDGEEISQDEVFDAMGEVVNVIGGNAKGIIDGECQLSLPCVGTFDEQPRSPTLALVFECCGLPMEVTMLDRDLP